MTKLFNFIQSLNLRQSMLFVFGLSLLNYLLIKLTDYIPLITITPSTVSSTVDDNITFNTILIGIIFFIFAPFLEEFIFRYRPSDLKLKNKKGYYYLYNTISFLTILSLCLYSSKNNYDAIGFGIYALYLILFIGKTLYTESEDISILKYDKYIVSASLAFSLFHIRNFDILNLNKYPNSLPVNLIFLILLVSSIYIFSLVMWIIRNKYKYGLLISGSMHLIFNILMVIYTFIWQ